MASFGSFPNSATESGTTERSLRSASREPCAILAHAFGSSQWASEPASLPRSLSVEPSAGSRAGNSGSRTTAAPTFLFADSPSSD